MKKILVKYGGFECEQEVDENLYNAIYQQGREDVLSELWKKATSEYDEMLTLEELAEMIEQRKEQRND